MLKNFENRFVVFMNRWGIVILRLSLAVVFIWFALLKLFGVSPVLDIVELSFDFLPFPATFYLLGTVELLIGLGLLFKISLKLTLSMLWLMLLSTFAALFLNPEMFFDGNVFVLTTEGEFVMKNIVLIASGLAIGGRELKP